MLYNDVNITYVYQQTLKSCKLLDLLLK